MDPPKSQSIRWGFRTTPTMSFATWEALGPPQVAKVVVGGVRTIPTMAPGVTVTGYDNHLAPIPWHDLALVCRACHMDQLVIMMLIVFASLVRSNEILFWC